MEALRQLELKGTFAAKIWPWLIPCIHSLGSAYLGGTLKCYIGYQRPRKLCWWWLQAALWGALATKDWLCQAQADQTGSLLKLTTKIDLKPKWSLIYLGISSTLMHFICCCCLSTCGFKILRSSQPLSGIWWVNVWRIEVCSKTK